MYDYGSPGKVFQLDEKSMEEYLEKLENEGKNLHEEFFLNENLKRNSIGGKFSYNKITNLSKGKKLLSNFNNCFYMTDTGRRWDGWNSSVRDKVAQQDQWFKKNITFHSTDDIIRSIQNDEFPDIVMFNFHPQRWHDSPFQWGEELIFQNIKNLKKKYFFA